MTELVQLERISLKGNPKIKEDLYCYITKNIKPYFKEHLDQYKKLYDKVYELISKKDTSNMKAFEEMMNLRNSEEVFGIDLNSTSGIEDM